MRGEGPTCERSQRKQTIPPPSPPSSPVSRKYFFAVTNEIAVKSVPSMEYIAKSKS